MSAINAISIDKSARLIGTPVCPALIDVVSMGAGHLSYCSCAPALDLARGVSLGNGFDECALMDASTNRERER